MQKRYVGVIGAAECGADVLQLAGEVGKAVAQAGAVLICGGRGGVMEAAAKGANLAGGVAIGILPGDDPRGGNTSLHYAIATGLGDARNAVIARTCDVLIAVAGGYGTLSEIALSLRMGKPVIGIHTWRCTDYCGKDAAIHYAADTTELKALLKRLLLP